MSVTASRRSATAAGPRPSPDTTTAPPLEPSAPPFTAPRPPLSTATTDGDVPGTPRTAPVAGAAPVTIAPSTAAVLHQVTTVEHQGTVIAFARDRETGAVYYDILDLKVSTEIDDAEWTGYNRLDVPAELRPLGLDLITVPDPPGGLLAPARVPFTAVSDEMYVHLLQQSARGSLLLSRYVYKRVVPDGGGVSVPVLEPAWEVRFQRSGKQDVANGPKDSQSYTGPDGSPFLEPVLELPIRDVADGNFAAQLLPTQAGAVRRWQLFAVNSRTGKLDCYSFPCDGTGLPELTGAQLDGVGVRPTMSLTLGEDSDHDLTLAGAPTAAVYALHEKARADGGGDLLLKRAVRNLVAVPVTTSAGERRFATLDFSLAPDGSLAEPPKRVVASPVGPANYALDFARGTYLSLRDQGSRLSIDGGFRIRFWMYPGSRVDADQYILRGAPAAPEQAAPYVKLTRDLRIEFGYGDGTAAVSAITAHPIARAAQWTEVEVGYDDPADEPLQIRINGHRVPVSARPGGRPQGRPLTTVCGVDDGFVGVLDDLALERHTGDRWTTAAHWPFDTVDYSTTPPTTPDESGNGNAAQVFGAALIPSTAPVPGRDTEGTLYVDDRGLSTYAGLLTFASPQASGTLLTGAGGLLHLYFAGPADAGRKDVVLSVAQYDARSARAVFEAEWQAGEDPSAQRGSVTFTAARSGTFMNAAQIEIGAATAAGLCDITLSDAQGHTEKWRGVPRALDALVDTLNGTTTHDLADPAFRAGTRTFYDSTGTCWTARLKALSYGVDAGFVLLSRRQEVLRVAGAELGAADAGSADLVLRYAVKGWEEPLTQTWQRVPLKVVDLTAVLAGTSQSYTYSHTGSCDAQVYALTASGPAGRSRDLLLLARPGTGELRVGIREGTAPDLCTVTFEVGERGRRIVLRDVPRDQNDLATAINTGEAGEHLRAVSDGMSATVVDRDTAEPPERDLRAWTGILVGFAEEAMAPDSALLPGQRADGAVHQGSTLDEKELDGASTLFRALAGSRPTNGLAALVQDGPASLAAAAAGGGWTRVSPHKAILVNGKNHVSFDVAAASADVLAIPGDLTVEAWCSPGAIDFRSPENELTRPRIADYRSPATPDAPGGTRWTLGLWPTSCLVFTDITSIRRSFPMPTNSDTTMQLTFAPTQAKASGAVLTLNTIGVTVPYLRMAVDAEQHILVHYLGQTGTLRSKALLKEGVFHQVTVVLHNGATPEVSLYVDGILDSSARPTRGSGNPGDFRVGAVNGGFPMKGNAALLWRRALTPQEVADVQAGPDLSDPDLLVSWPIDEGSGKYVTNAAVGEAGIRTEILNERLTGWARDGAFGVPWAANRMLSLVAARPIMRGWHHIASSYRSGHAVALDGRQYADCGNGTTLDATDTFSVEACFTPATNADGTEHGLVSKPGNYELRITPAGTLALSVWTDTLGVVELTTVDKDGKPTYRIESGLPCYAAAVVSTGTVKAQGTNGQAAPPRYYLHALLYANGKPKGEFRHDDLPEPAYVQTTDTHLNLGRSPRGGAYFTGLLSDVRLWNTALTASAIAATATTRQPPSANGLVSSWRWSEGSGKYGYDDKGLNTAVLTANNLWQVDPATARMALTVDGIEQTDARYDGTLVDDVLYGREQFTAGGALKRSGQVFDAFLGQLSELRVWNRTRTAEQIREDMYRVLVGNETGLAGYWQFDTGSGTTALDATGHGNSGVLEPVAGPPRWVDGRPPLSNEAREVYNVLGGQVTMFTERVTGTPSAAEYDDTRYDAYGQLYSVMKRTYAADRAGAARLVSGYTVGDLDMVYAGQVQTEPSVVGFIEGAAPLPSENLTNPFWSDQAFSDSYADRSRTRVTHAESVTHTFTGSQADGTATSAKVGRGMFLEVDTTESVGVGAESGWTLGKIKAKAGLSAERGSARRDEEEAAFGYGTTATTSDEIAAGGEWEHPDHLLNPDVGRRYVPGNNGYAVVKSLTADMYLLMLQGSKTVVRTVLVPDPDIPEDVNVITFPIEPRYVRNGTLDGMVGFTPDPAYPDAAVRRGSYFKPVEAYALKRAVERQDKQLEAFYRQFDTPRLSRPPHTTPQGTTESGFTEFRERVIARNPAYDRVKALSKRAIVNTYVWTAGGGLHAEQTEIVDTRSESYSGLSSTDATTGLIGRLSLGAPVGFFVELDATFGTSVEVLSVRDRDSETGFALDVEFTPERRLKKPEVDGNGVPVGFSEDDAPGKVTGYRFLSFLIPQSAENFGTMMHEVIDSNWLQNSAHPDAAALRTATGQTNGVWRVLHRTTYVSRVAPPLQPAPAESTAPPVTEPAGLHGNTLLVRLVRGLIPMPSPSPAQIGTAVRTVLGTGPDDRDCLLTGLLPWWKTFLEQATDPRADAATTLSALRVDLLAYVIQDYAARPAQHGAA